MSQFYPRDVVVCLTAAQAQGLRAGGLYRVQATYADEFGEKVVLDGVDAASARDFGAMRFAKLEAADCHFVAQMRAMRPANGGAA